MSNDAISWAYQQGLPTGPKFVLVVLADWADDEGSCFPGVPKIAQRTAMGESTVKRHLETLKERGYIVSEYRIRKDGSRTSNRYLLQMLGLKSRPSTPVRATPQTGDVGLDLDGPKSQIGRGILEPPEDNHQITSPPIPPTTEVELLPLLTSDFDMTPYTAKPDLEAEFNRAYAHWPKKSKREDALKRFRAVKKLPLPELVAAIIEYGDAYGATTPVKYVPALGVWLNGERWTDDLPVADVDDRKLTGPEKNLAYLAQVRAEEAAERDAAAYYVEQREIER